MPARLVVYFVLAMCLFSGQSYEEVARLLTAGLQGARRWRASRAVPSTAAIWKARSRLGVAPLRQLFARACRPVAAPDTQSAFYHQKPLVSPTTICALPRWGPYGHGTFSCFLATGQPACEWHGFVDPFCLFGQVGDYLAGQGDGDGHVIGSRVEPDLKPDDLEQWSREALGSVSQVDRGAARERTRWRWPHP